VDSSIKFNVSANTAQFQSGMRQVDTVSKSTAAGIKQAFSGVGSMLIGGAAVAGLKSLMNDFDKIAKVATRFGASAEDIQRVSVAADLAGVSIDTVARVLTKMSVAASDAAAGNDAMADAFAKAGINAQAFKSASLDQQLIILSEAFNEARGNADRTNQIIELMGTRAAGQMIPLIDNTSALREEMAGVAVASDDVVRKIEAANDRLTRFGNEGKVAAAFVLEGFINLSERLGSLMADLGGIAKLSAAIPLALTGNVMPLWHVLQTGKTIKEMEEIEARANAINQLTREGSFGINAEKNAALIVERTEQILAATRDINQQMSISEETLDSSLGLEKEKTAELAKQAEQLARQEAQRQGAIRDMGAEIALIEAQLSGNKKLEESLRQQADFQSALEKTDNTETAANFAAAKAAERAAQAGKQGGGSGGGGFSSGGVNRSALDRLQDMSQGGNVDARTALMRLQAEQDRFSPRAAQLQQSGMFRSAAAAQIRNENRMQDRAMSELTKQTRDQFFGARNAGDAARNFERDALKAGMTTKEAMGNMGIDRKLGESTRDALDRFAKEQAKTQTERAKEEANQGGGGGGSAGGADGGVGDLTTVVNRIETILKQSLPISAMV
jgi:ribosomal protein L12E/L44/L45/RPP1/RPP2